MLNVVKVKIKKQLNVAPLLIIDEDSVLDQESLGCLEKLLQFVGNRAFLF
jgi:hypothetical protein